MSNTISEIQSDDTDTAFVDSEPVAETDTVALPAKIERTDIKAHPIQVGETEIVVQRHGAYIRDKEDPHSGGLSSESADIERVAATSYFETFLAQIPEAERATVDVLIVASDTRYHNRGQRSLETAIVAQGAALDVFEAQNLPTTNIINNTGKLSGEGGPRTVPKLREPNFLDKDPPEFIKFMLEEYGGVNVDFWTAFEQDRHKDLREAMGAEGPDDIADRTAFAIRTLARYAQVYHKAKPGRRLIIWTATHYDTISPFVKRDVFGVGKDTTLMVDYGAGITIDVDQTGVATTEIAGKLYPVSVTKPQPTTV